MRRHMCMRLFTVALLTGMKCWKYPNIINHGTQIPIISFPIYPEELYYYKKGKIPSLVEANNFPWKDVACKEMHMVCCIHMYRYIA